MAQHLVVLAVLLPMILGVMGDPRTSNITTVSVVQKYGYPIETHKVTTNDGYILTMHRIPYSPNPNNTADEPSSEPKPVVFIQHGLLCSSIDWVMLGPKRALALLLADEGFDVWLGNARGNTYSRQHINMDADKDGKYWDFDWHEIGTIDLPTMLDYVREKTGVKKVVYIGHSQGTTAFLVLNSLNPDYNKYFESAHLLSPVAYMSHLTSPFVKYVAPLLGRPTLIGPMDLLGHYEFKPSKTLMNIVAAMMCDKKAHNYKLCSNALFLAAGFDSDTIDPSIIDDVMETGPAAASTKQFLHYMQEYNSGYFREFDYGMARNLIKYRSTKPPNYPIGNIDVPLYLYYSDNDALAAVEDVHQLIRELNCVQKAYRVPEANFDHLGQMYNPRIRDHVYDILKHNIHSNTATGRTI
ncbi:lipase 3-like [Eupeodes corollae]|uniref:lipase 3-like n=1 Tax=Eupeodes corollae TaxID=290404 RepID=UPI0024924D69|nr:lipase 3-like [Eupeodes corollae]